MLEDILVLPDMPQQAHHEPALFPRFARWAERQVGSSGAFCLAASVIVIWAATGPLFRWSDTWQLVINTGTTIVTFLMVFLIQNTQTRDTQALHLKIDELIRVTQEARNSLLDLEERPEAEIEKAKETLQRLVETAESPNQETS